MISRLLPHAEWWKLDGTEAGPLWRTLSPEAQVLVVEDGDRIAGCWILMHVLHVECLYIAPEHRKRTGVARRLWAGMARLVREAGGSGVVTAATSDEVRGLLDKVGAVKVPGDSYAFSFARVKPAADERCLAAGRKFHEQLEGLLTAENHPDDEAHNLAVGRAIVAVVDGASAPDALRDYNVWAGASGYMPASCLEEMQGPLGRAFVVDIGTAVVGISVIGQEFNVMLIEERTCLS